MIELLSLHVPKTAGTAFGKILSKIYGDEIYYDYTGRTRPDRVLPKFRVIHGHFPMMKYAGLFPEAKKIAWLRHPIQRIISLYYFWMKNPPVDPIQYRMQESKMSIYDFVKLPEMSNDICTRFLGTANVSDFFFIGIQEFFAQDMSELSRLLGWVDVDFNIPLEHSNKNISTEYSLRAKQLLTDKKLIDSVNKFHNFDLSFYYRALEIRERRREILSGIDFKWKNDYWEFARRDILKSNLPCCNFPYKVNIQAPSEIKISAGEPIEFQVRIKNLCEIEWRDLNKFPFNLGNHWLDENGYLLKYDDARIPLPKAVKPGDEIQVRFSTHAPDIPGKYKLELDIVNEQVAWFKQYGSETAIIQVYVYHSDIGEIISIKNDLGLLEKENSLKFANDKINSIQERLLTIKKQLSNKRETLKLGVSDL